jgi:hypothetical protein
MVEPTGAVVGQPQMIPRLGVVRGSTRTARSRRCTACSTGPLSGGARHRAAPAARPGATGQPPRHADDQDAACPIPTRFLVVSIRQGGNIRRLVSQETPGYGRGDGMIKPAAILCMVFGGSGFSCRSPGGSRPCPIGAAAARARRHRPSPIRDRDFVPQRERSSSPMVEQGLTNLLQRAPPAKPGSVSSPPRTSWD